jgi:hypothetical protein
MIHETESLGKRWLALLAVLLAVGDDSGIASDF